MRCGNTHRRLFTGIFGQANLCGPKWMKMAQASYNTSSKGIQCSYSHTSWIVIVLCKMYEDNVCRMSLFLLVKFVTLPPPVHPRSFPSAKPVAKLKVYKLPNTSNKPMQLGEKMQNNTFQMNTFSLFTVCHHLASNSTSAACFSSPPLASIFCRTLVFIYWHISGPCPH